MQGMSERQYAAHVGLSRGAIQKAKAAERLVLYPDGSINAAASDASRACVSSNAIAEARFSVIPSVRGNGMVSCRPSSQSRRPTTADLAVQPNTAPGISHPPNPSSNP